MARRANSWLVLLPVALLALAALACAAPRTNYVSTAGAVPYWACATPTPVPPDEYLITPTPYGPPYWATTEPEPTATPFYRLGEFYLGQTATVGSLQVRLVSLAGQAGGYTLARFVVINRAGAETIAPLSLMAFGLGTDGRLQGYDPASQERAGLPKASDLESASIAPGGELDETLAITGMHTRIGLGTNLLASAGGGAQPMWFNGSADPVRCPHGEAVWPVQLPRPAGYGYLGPLTAPRADLIGGPVPVENYVRITAPFGCNPWNGDYTGWCPGDSPYYHTGLDLSAVQGEPIYTPIAGTVQFADWNYGGYGYLVVVRADLGGGDYLFMYFAHMMEAPLVVAGDHVHCGQNIGFVGSTGHSTGPHLHWETRRGTNADDPTQSYYLVNPEDTRPLWPVLCQQG